jgi:large subunit ribosomal protein L7Ae
LEQFVYKKTAAVLSVGDVGSDRELATLISAPEGQLVSVLSFVCYLIRMPHGDISDKCEDQWGGGIRVTTGNKSTQMLKKRAKAAGQSISAAGLRKL